MKRSSPVAFALLALAALPTLWVLWFLISGALAPEDEVLALYGPVLTEAEGTARWTLLPSWPTLRPVVRLLLDTPEFFAMFWNSCEQSFPQAAGQILVGAPAAWALSRLRFPGRKFLFAVYMALMVLPFQVTMVAHYIVLSRLSLIDTVWAVILPGVFSTFPVFIMKKGFDAVPYALLESAALDGAGHAYIFFRIGLPLGVPGILSAFVLGFLEAWNAIEQPMVFLESARLRPLSLYLTDISAADAGLALAASLLMLTPAMLIFLFGQKYLELGIQASGLKDV